MLIRLLMAAVLLFGCGWAVANWLGEPYALATTVLLALFLLARHERQIARLTTWAEQPLGTPVPQASGIWSPPFLALHRRARQAANQRQELHDMVERFRLAAEALPDGVIILDHNRSIEWMNAHAERLLGLDSRRDLGMVIGHLLREPEFVPFFQQLADPQPPLLVKPLRNPGHVLQIRAAPFSAGRTLLLVEDLTQLDRLENVRRDFVANVSHELRTPLTVVQGFLETVRDGLADTEHPAPAEESIQFLDLALDHARRMRRLLEDLLTLSSLETDAPPQEETIEVAGLLALVREEALALSAGRHTIQLCNDGPAQILGSSRELHSAFSNLASNAVRYTPDGGNITLSWERHPDGAVFSVRDSGIGIDSHHLPRLTERFYRVDRGRSRDSGGTGLGLAIVKHVLERHEARLNITSVPGQGSCFSVQLPARRVVTAAAPR